MTQQQKFIGILGNGDWAKALIHCAMRNNHHIAQWSRHIDDRKSNNKITSQDFNKICDIADYILFALPSFCFMDMIDSIPVKKPIIQCAKGIYCHDNHVTLFSDIAKQKNRDYALLSGPNFAKEILNNLPAITTISSHNNHIMQMVKEDFQHPLLRFYPSNNIIGCEIFAMAKNIIAIACGIAIGAGYGENARAAIFTRGLHEINQLTAMLSDCNNDIIHAGAIGDMVLTALSKQSRNTQLGMHIGQIGYFIHDDKAPLSEGLCNIKGCYQLARQHHLTTPVIDSVYSILYLEKSVHDIVDNLLKRP